MKTSSIVILTFISFSLFAVSAVAQSDDDFHPFLSDNFNVSIGGFWPNKSFKLRVDGSAPEEEIDFEEDLGLSDRDTTGSLNFRWRFGEKWSLWGQYWNLDDSGGTVLTEDIEWEDIVFKEGTYAAAGFDTSYARLFLGRNFWTRPGHEFGAGLGFHWLSIGAYIEGQILTSVGDLEVQQESVDADFPLPNIGAWYKYSWSSKWIVSARVDWLSATVGDYSGGLWNVQAGVDWAVFEHFGLGLYYNLFKLNVDVDQTDWRGKVETTQAGPYLALTATW